jgi:hypothetical protein
MTEPLWSDERVQICADIHSMGHYATDNKAAVEFRITTALKEMRDEYESEVQELRKQVADLGVLHAVHSGTITPPSSLTIEQVTEWVTTGNTMEDGKD